MKKKNSPTSLINEDGREIGSNGLHDSYNDGSNDGGDVGSSGLEDVVGVEDDGVDAAELLEEHEAEAADERHAGRAVC